MNKDGFPQKVGSGFGTSERVGGTMGFAHAYATGLERQLHAIPTDAHQVLTRETDLLTLEPIPEPEMRREVLRGPLCVQNLQPTRQHGETHRGPIDGDDAAVLTHRKYIRDRRHLMCVDLG